MLVTDNERGVSIGPAHLIEPLGTDQVSPVLLLSDVAVERDDLPIHNRLSMSGAIVSRALIAI